MKLKFYKSHELEKTYRISVHRSGKVGFPREAAQRMKLSAHKSADIGSNEEDKEDQNLYLVLHPGDEGSFKISKAGEYFYLNTKLLFENLKVPYETGEIGFDMEKMEIDGNTYYKLKPRKNDKKEEKVD